MLTWENAKTFLTDLAATVGLKLLYAVLLLAVGLRLIRFITKRLRANTKVARVDASVYSFIISFANILMYILLFISVAAILGVDTTSFAAILASASVAVGLALQGALSNFAGGIMILLFKPFRVGDYIETSSHSGTVRDITVFYTILTTLDNKRVTLPNGTLTNSAVTNYSAEETRRVDIVFSAGYDSDIDTVKRIMLETATAHPLVSAEPAPFARMTQQSASSLDFTLRVWCACDDYWNVYFDLNEQIKKAFDANEIQIPFPQLDVHVEK